MRIVQLLLTALAVIVAIVGGLFTAVVAAVTIILVFLSRRLFGKTRPAIAAAPRPRPAPMRRPPASDVIEVTATEVHEDRQLR